MTGPKLLMSSAFAAVLLFGSVAAEETSDVLLNATFLGSPVDWCAPNDGIPLIIRMDGPDIIKGPNDIPRQVKERRGSSVRVVSSDGTASFNPPELFDGANAVVVGRFSAEFQTCFSPWRAVGATGKWNVSRQDGSDLETGAFENEFVSLPMPFFVGVGSTSTAHYAKFGDRILFTATRPKLAITQTFLAEQDEE